MPAPGPPIISSLTPGDAFGNTSRARLQALYSDFTRQKQSNPTTFHANVEWWRIALQGLVNSAGEPDASLNTGSRLTLRADRSLLERLRIEKIGKPLAMGAVINELLSSRSLISMSEFMSSRTSIYDPGWFPYRIASFVVGKPLWWALEQVGIVGEEGVLSFSSHKETDWFGEYVFVELVEQAADAVISLYEERMASPADALYTLESFRKSFGSIAGSSNQMLTETDAKVLLKYLEREREVVILDKDVVKFVNRTGLSDECTVTSVDRGILEVKSAIDNMHRIMDVIQGRINYCTEKAKVALQQKQKQTALSYLKSRKQLQDLHDKRLSSLEILEGTMISIEAAIGDVQIMKTYATSTSTLRAILSHPALDQENIEETMDALDEANRAAQEVDNAIRVEGDMALGIDISEEEIEEEWEALVRDIEADVGVSRKLGKLQVPDNIPGIADADESSTRVPIPTR